MQTASPEHCAIATRVSTAVGRASSLSMSRAQRSGYIAALSNCVPVGQASAYAAMVAHPVEDPSIIVKVCTGNDGFILYALLCLNGMLRGPEYLVVHSAAQVGDSWVFVTERLQEFKLRGQAITDAEYAVSERLAELLRATKVREQYADTCAPDLHLGNIMLRGDQPVILDPWAETHGHHIVGGVPVKVRTAQEYHASKRSVQQLVPAYVRPGRVLARSCTC